MPTKLSGYQKVINKCNRVGWNSHPIYEDGIDYDALYKIIAHREAKIKIGMTHSPKSWTEYYKLLLDYKKFKPGIYLDKLIFIHGIVDGTKIFEEYKQKQAYTNSFEYKSKKYGMTKEQYDDYNKSRAVTLNNLILKHGEEMGKEKYDIYCSRQAYTNSLEYFGLEKYKEVNRKKSHTLDTYINRHGEELGGSKLLEFYGKLSPNRSYSKISQKCFRVIESLLTQKELSNLYYATKNKEYCILVENKVFLYDFVCPKLNLCIEYHGDHYHGNPKLYNPDDYLKGRGCTRIRAKDKWEQDEIKANMLKNHRGYDTIVIWDSIWREDPNLILSKLHQKIITLRG